jgi:succinoglycan biosynthesis protein ExoH
MVGADWAGGNLGRPTIPQCRGCRQARFGHARHRISVENLYIHENVFRQAFDFIEKWKQAWDLQDCNGAAPTSQREAPAITLQIKEQSGGAGVHSRGFVRPNRRRVNTMKISRDISRRIAIARYFMIIGIVVLHMPPFKPLSAYALDPFDMFRGMLTFGVFRATVPTLTAISAYLLFSAELDRQFFSLMQKKIRTLLVPLLLWNLPMLPLLYWIQKNGLVGHHFDAELYPAHLANWIDAATGVFHSPLNYPTHFLRNLFALALLAPPLGLLLRRAPSLGLAIVFIVYWYDLDGDLLLRNSMLLSFYVGGLAAVRGWNLRALDRYAPLLLAVLMAMAVAIVAFRIQNREWFALVSPILVWPCMSLIAPTRLGALLHRYSGASFFTFLAHGPLLVVIWILFQRYGTAVPYSIFWAVTPPAVVLFCAHAHRAFWKLLPGVAALSLGDRGKQSGGAGADARVVPAAGAAVSN